MDPLTIGIVSIAVLVVLILLGLHIGLVLALTSFGALYVMSGRLSVAANVLERTAYSAVMDYVYAVIPLFVLMGLLTTASGATGDLFKAAERLMQRVTGGVGVATVMANAIFAAITGVSVASAAVFSRIAVPEMMELKYERPFSLGIVGASSLLGMLIPPSILMIVFALVTEQSVGRMFAAGIMPGVLVALILVLAIWVQVHMKPSRAGVGQTLGPRHHARDRFVLLRPWPFYLLVLLVLGGIYGGFFTPIEAGAVGAFGAFLMLLSRMRISAGGVLKILLDTGKSTASIFLLLITAQMYSRMLTLSGLPQAISGWASGLEVGIFGIVAIFVLILLGMGMILDSVSILLLAMPVMFPVVQSLGLDPIWFGIVAIVTIEIGLLTPPFGMVIFAMKASLPEDVRIEEIYRGTAPFILALLAALILLISLPQITLWLPQQIYG